MRGAQLSIETELEQVRGARRNLERVRLKLLRPGISAFEGASADLASALKCLAGLDSGLASAARRKGGVHPALENEIRGLRDDLQRVNALLAGAGRLFEGWARLVSYSGRSCELGFSEDEAWNYTAAGKVGVPVVTRASKVVLHG